MSLITSAIIDPAIASDTIEPNMFRWTTRNYDSASGMESIERKEAFTDANYLISLLCYRQRQLATNIKNDRWDSKRADKQALESIEDIAAAIEWLMVTPEHTYYRTMFANLTVMYTPTRSVEWKIYRMTREEATKFKAQNNE